MALQIFILKKITLEVDSMLCKLPSMRPRKLVNVVPYECELRWNYIGVKKTISAAFPRSDRLIHPLPHFFLHAPLVFLLWNYSSRGGAPVRQEPRWLHSTATLAQASLGVAAAPPEKDPSPPIRRPTTPRLNSRFYSRAKHARLLLPAALASVS